MKFLVFGLGGQTRGGIESFLLNMNAYMSDDVIFDYVVLRGDEPSIHENEISARGGKIHYVTSYSKNLIAYVGELKHILKAGKSVYHAAYVNLFSMVHIFPAFLARHFGYKVILHSHNNCLAGSRIKHIVHGINRFLFSGMKCTRLTNSDLSTEYMFGKEHLNDTELIYNAIDTDKFAYNETVRTQLRSSMNIGGRLYGFSGRLMYQKNPLFLLDIFSEIKRLDPTASFIVCGDGNLMNATKHKADELGINVIFTGAVKNMNAYYQLMDCFIQPSHFEGLGITLVEAQCSGLPCVTSADVVPKIVKVTDLLEYIGLDKEAAYWAKKCVELVNKSHDREDYASIVSNSGFNIKKEAKRLEALLCN